VALCALTAVGCNEDTLDLTVNVTEQGTQLPIPNATVTVTDDNKGQQVPIQPNTTNDFGRFLVSLAPEQAPPGHHYTVQVSAPGYQTQSQSFQASQEKSQSDTVSVALTPTQPHLAVTVSDAASNQSLAGASVSVTPADAQPPLTDSNGLSFFALKASTAYAVTASLSGYAPSAPATVSFDASNAGQTLTIALAKKAPLLVKAVDVSTTPNQGIPGATMFVFDVDGRTQLSGQTGGDGGVTFQVDPGHTYGATGQAPGYTLVQNLVPPPVTYPPGSTAAQTLTVSFIPSDKNLPPP
jgi:hypothetical protein